jgi:hypothetical protein
MNRAIDEAVEKFYIATGINTECVRGRLRGPDRDADLLVVVGQPRFGAVRGHAPAPAKAFVEVLGTRFRTFVLSEYSTSKRCDVCGAPLIKTRARSVRYWRCPMAGGSMAYEDFDEATKRQRRRRSHNHNSSSNLRNETSSCNNWMSATLLRAPPALLRSVAPPIE